MCEAHEKQTCPLVSFRPAVYWLPLVPRVIILLCIQHISPGCFTPRSVLYSSISHIPDTQILGTNQVFQTQINWSKFTLVANRKCCWPFILERQALLHFKELEMTCRWMFTQFYNAVQSPDVFAVWLKISKLNRKVN